MKTLKSILAIFAFVIFATCERPNEIYINLPEIYKADDIRVEYTETDFPTETCSNGEIQYSVYRNDTLIYQDVKCRNSGFYWDYLSVEGGCDTLYNYNYDGTLNFAVPLCPEIIETSYTVVVHDTIPNDTVEVHHQSAFWNFNTGDTHTHEAIGFANLHASESQGTNRYHFNTSSDEVIAWTKYPVFGHSSNLDSVSIKWGSVCKYYIELIEEFYPGEKVLYGKIVGETKDFDVCDDASYDSFNYPFPKGNYSGKRLMIKVYKINGVTYPSNPTRKQEFNINEIYYSWSWIE